MAAIFRPDCFEAVFRGRMPLRRYLSLSLLPLFIFLSVVRVEPVFAQQEPAIQPSSEETSQSLSEGEIANGALEDLLSEAQELFIQRRPIDARAKLQQALKKAPRDYRPHMLLGAYYLTEVAHFKLAYRYLRTAEQLFYDTYGSDEDGTLQSALWREHARLLYLIAEARLNLDQYEGALAVLDRFGALYWDDWYPGTRAWVLMKLRRVDEAIRVAQAGLLRGAEPGRTYNILGILLSLKGNSELSLQAFAQAIRAEIALGGSGQVATPLNNAGEVYREMFSDNLAEACWLRATSMPDGCDHILPSLNLAILYIDELRLLQAERVLEDFEACFAVRSFRADTEHRTLLALAKGRLALHMGDTDEALKLLTFASEQEQWFGKIGTNENDVRFAVSIALAQALEARASALEDEETTGIGTKLRAQLEKYWIRIRARWLYRRAREIALDELEDFEDLSIRHTDSMIEYPTLGWALHGFPVRSMRSRMVRMTASDNRQHAQNYYSLYLATNLLHHSRTREAEKILRDLIGALRPIDRLVRAEALGRLLQILESRLSFWRRSDTREAEINRLREDLFALLPSHLRYLGSALPVQFVIREESDNVRELRRIAHLLARTRFEIVHGNSLYQPRYRLELDVESSTAQDGEDLVGISLIDTHGPDVVVRASGPALADDDKARELINKFIALAFRHRVDPPGEPVADLELLRGIF